jgi:dihydroorotase
MISRFPAYSTFVAIVLFSYDPDCLAISTDASFQPNLVPPVTTVQQCLEYRDRLRAIEPNVDYLMSLYLHESITPEVIREAKKAGITGVKSYPAGVTTASLCPSVSHHF